LSATRRGKVSNEGGVEKRTLGVHVTLLDVSAIENLRRLQTGQGKEKTWGEKPGRKKQHGRTDREESITSQDKGDLKKKKKQKKIESMTHLQPETDLTQIKPRGIEEVSSKVFDTSVDAILGTRGGGRTRRDKKG